MPSFLSKLLLGGQIAGTLGGFCLLAAWPASAGRMLAIPLDAEASGALTARLARGDSRLVAAGPLPGSWVVEGERAAIGAALRDLSVLLTNAPRSGCAATGLAS